MWKRRTGCVRWGRGRRPLFTCREYRSDIRTSCEHERGRRVGWVPDPAFAVLYERWRLVGPPEPPCGGGFKAPCAAAVTAVRGERHGKGALSACQLGTGKMVGNICRGRVERCKATSEPGPPVCPGKSLGDTRLLPRRRPAYRQHEPGPGSRMERVKVTPRSDTYGWREGGPRAAESVRGRVPVAGHAGGPSRSSWEAR